MAVLMGANFSACGGSDEGSPEFIRTELIINEKTFMKHAWQCYVDNTPTDACSTFWYGNYESVNEKGNKVDIYDEYFYGEIEGELTDGTFCNIELDLEGMEMGESRKSLTPFKKTDLNLTKYSEYFRFGVRIDLGSFYSYESGNIYVKSFTSDNLTLSFDSCTLKEDEKTILLNGIINFKYIRAKIQDYY